jgi:hypothetical protein
LGNLSGKSAIANTNISTIAPPAIRDGSVRDLRLIFGCNQNGSRNPDEAMLVEDFELAVRLLALGIVDLD